jgi:hypothetical protein
MLTRSQSVALFAQSRRCVERNRVLLAESRRWVANARRHLNPSPAAPKPQITQRCRMPYGRYWRADCCIRSTAASWLAGAPGRAAPSALNL